MSCIYISCYTENTPYQKEVNNLIKSLNRFGLRHHINGYKHQGSWEKNCQYKAVYILEALKRFRSNVVWLDADAVVEQQPGLFNELDCDLAYHYLEHRNELLSGTLFFRNNKHVKALVERWIELNRKNTEWDQKNLQRVLERDNTLTRKILPAEYCKIFDNKKQPAKSPVIVHYQASRRYKRIVGKARPLRAQRQLRRRA